MTPLAFFTPGPLELGIIAVIAVLLFGKRLPSIARSVGSSFIEFKKGIQGVEDEIEEAKKPFEEASQDVKKAADMKDRS